MAPEAVCLGNTRLSMRSQRVEYDPTKSDVFAFGFVLFECITFQREPISRAEAPTDTDMAGCPILIARDFFGTGVKFEDNNGLVQLMQCCFDPDPEARPTFAQICVLLDAELETC